MKIIHLGTGHFLIGDGGFLEIPRPQRQFENT